MSFKDTILPDFVVAELYGNLLIQTSEAAAAAPMPRTAHQPGTGGNTPGPAADPEIERGQSRTGERPGPDEKMPGMPAGRAAIKSLPAAEETTAIANPGIPATVQSSVGPYRYLGKNQKKVAVVARYAHDPYIPEQHLEFLTKLLSACKLNLGDVAIINDSVQAVKFDKLSSELSPAFVLLFDIQPSEIGLPLSFPLLKAQSFSDCVFLTIPAIADLLQPGQEVIDTKKKLWAALQKMFL